MTQQSLGGDFFFIITIGFQESFQETATVAWGYSSVNQHLGL